MSSKNAIEVANRDVIFAEQYVQYLATRSNDPHVRARAKLLVTLFLYLDVELPDWRLAVAEAVTAAGVVPESAKMFTLPEMDANTILTDLLKSLGKPPSTTNS